MGGNRRGAGRPVDPNSMRSQIRGLAGKEDFVTLPASGRVAPAPEWPLTECTVDELALWGKLWCKPQALMWEIQGIDYAVAMYVRTYFEAVEPGAVAGLKTAALRMEGELGLSLPGMKTLGWQIISDEDSEPVAKTPAGSGARKTTGKNWLSAVSVAGS
jgi:hypothetical protein